MKNKYRWLLLLFLSACNGFDSLVPFSEPQPAGKRAMDAIPRKLQGKYFSERQQAFLWIGEHSAALVMDYDVVTTRKELDTAYRLSGDSLFNSLGEPPRKVAVQGDTIRWHEHETDSVFDIARGDVLKKDKGYYFLNRRLAANSWTVTRLSLSHGKLLVANVDDPASLARLETLAEKPTDTVHPVYTISRKQFRNLQQEGGFRTVDSFFKTKP
ncbi:hypothetical protein [Taibaiella helva]|uniref:hypothetical protein n=1 Tax=Taibaiella helva TaxID=2301235 RepID=UPI000E584583|nr:hypothetical protein [Taibaiella helva]